MSDRAHVIKNLAFNMGVAQLIFQLGAHQTQSKVGVGHVIADIEVTLQ